MNYENIQVGFNEITKQPIFKTREIKPRTTKYLRRAYKGSSNKPTTWTRYLTANES